MPSVRGVIARICSTFSTDELQRCATHRPNNTSYDETNGKSAQRTTPRKVSQLNLELALSDIASYFNLDPAKLIEYAYEDKIGGWDNGKGGWPIGSIWSVEGRVLYALVRATRPTYCVELGTYHGCSATHIAAALKANGDDGVLTCVENGGYGLAQPDLVPEYLRDYMTFVTADAAEYMEQRYDKVDFIFEDSAHNEEITRRVWKAAQTKLADGGFIVSHDAMHFLVGQEIRKGILNSGATSTRFYSITPSDCGLAIARASEHIKVKTAVYGGVEQSLKELGVEIKEGYAPTEKSTPVEKPKRTRKASTTKKATRTRKAKA